MVVMLRAEQLHRLVDQALVERDLLGRRGELGLIVGDHVERDVGAERDAAVMGAGDQRRIHQDLVARHRIVDAVAGLRRSAEARSRRSSRSGR